MLPKEKVDNVKLIWVFVGSKLIIGKHFPLLRSKLNRNELYKIGKILDNGFLTDCQDRIFMYKLVQGHNPMIYTNIFKGKMKYPQGLREIDFNVNGISYGCVRKIICHSWSQNLEQITY